MALKVTTKDGMVLEGDAKEVIEALQALQSPAPTVYRGEPGSFPGSADDVSGEPSSRNPRGMNRKLVLQALAAAGSAGMLQAHAQQWILLNKHEELAISSVRHALTQLQDRDLALRSGDLWRITAAGVKELAELESPDWVDP